MTNEPASTTEPVDETRNTEHGSLTHLDGRGAAQMVDVSEKALTVREAVAARKVWMQRALALIQSGGVPLGDILSVAQIAGIVAARRTSEPIPLHRVQHF